MRSNERLQGCTKQTLDSEQLPPIDRILAASTHKKLSPHATGIKATSNTRSYPAERPKVHSKVKDWQRHMIEEEEKEVHATTSYQSKMRLQNLKPINVITAIKPTSIS